MEAGPAQFSVREPYVHTTAMLFLFTSLLKALHFQSKLAMPRILVKPVKGRC